MSDLGSGFMNEDVEHDGGPPLPRANPALLGHEAAEKELLDTFASGRMAHAWLISGPRGIGKATLAYRFARYLLAGAGRPASDGPGLFGDELPASDANSLFIDPGSSVFRRIAGGGHADFLCVERTVNDRGKLRMEIVVDDVRAVGGFFGLTAAEGGWRVVVIDSADEMNRNAANAVLKVLEEPPAGALMLLVCHNPARLLPTIRSRCRTLNLSSLSDEVVRGLLQQHYPNLPDEDASMLARLSEGSAGRAMALAGEGGLDIYQELTGLLETLPRLDGVRLHDFGGKLAKAGADAEFRTGMEFLTTWLNRLICSIASGDGGIIGPVSDAERDLIDRLGKAAPLDRWLQVWEKINLLLARTDGANLDRKQVVLNVFLTLEDAVRP